MADDLRTRFRAFLAYVRPKLLHLSMDGARTVQLRRIADLRLDQLAVKKPDMNAGDVNRQLLADPKKTPFVTMALEEKLLHSTQASNPVARQSEEMGFLIELCILSDLLPEPILRTYLKRFVLEHPLGAAPSAPPPVAPAAPSPSHAPLPPHVQALLGHAKDLWAIPATTQAVLQKLSAPDPNLEEIASLLERDPGLSAQLLRVVNSAFYGLSRRIASVRRAIVTLGFQTTKQITTIASLVSRLGQEHGQVKFDLKNFWGHSLWVAHAARSVSKQIRVGAPDEHFTAGLMHDIGKLVTYQYLRHGMNEILAGVAQGGRYEEVETRVLGVNHAVIGACLCERWDFPASVVEAVRHHLDPLEALEDLPLPRPAWIVCAMCSISRTSTESAPWGRHLQIPAEILKAAGEEATQHSLGSLRDVFAYA